MKYIHILSCLSLLAGACSSDDDFRRTTGANSEVVSTVSFNIRVDNPVDGDNVWANRREAVVKMIGIEKPTVMGLQEAQAHQINYLAVNCPEYAWYGVGRDTGEIPPATESYSAEECMAVFYRKDEVELLDKGTFWLAPGAPETPTKGWDAGYCRSFTWTKFRHKTTGREFFFFNTHLDNSGTQARKQSLQLIARKVQEINAEGLPAMLTADFNSDTSETIFVPLLRVMHDARSLAAFSDSKPSFNGYTGESDKVLDHIFYTGWIVSRFRTLTNDYGAPYISDHYPVMARFVWMPTEE